MIFKNVVCPYCGCLCDDLEVTVEGGAITGLKKACTVSRSKFLNHGKNRAKPMVKKNGELVEVSHEESVDRAVEILRDADYPLIYGLSSTDCEAQSDAIELGEILGGAVDNTSSVCHGPVILAVQTSGIVKCTLGEVKNRADLLVFWGSNPVEAHMRHMERYSTPIGMFTEGGRKDRTVVCIDVRETPTAKASDIFAKVEHGRDFEFISALKATLKGHEMGDVAGISSQFIKELANKMKSCRFGALFVGVGLTMTEGKHMNIDAAIGLVRDLNNFTRFTISPMRGHYNVTGADETSLWQTGYPYAVDFSRGYPRYNPGEFTAVDVLARGECDAALIIASDPVANLPNKASRHLAKIPTIVMDPKVSMTSLISEVVIPTATSGIECGGTAYRMDGVPIMLRQVIEPEYPSDEEILKRMIVRLKS